MYFTKIEKQPVTVYKDVEVKEEITLSYNWTLDVQNLCSVAMHNNLNNAEDSIRWIYKLIPMGNYELALKKEAVKMIADTHNVKLPLRDQVNEHKTENNMEELNAELGKIFEGIFGKGFTTRY